jgi:molybdopterin-guanine dinucleotide biosynthesis protein A
VCGAYRRTALPAIAAALDAGRFRAADVAENLDVTWLEGLDAAQFQSLNTPADLARFNAELPSQR